MNISDHYRAYDRQKQFHNARAKYRLFGGAAGPGKTKALLWEAIGQALETPGSDTLLLRRTYPELESSLLLQFRRDVPSEFYKSYNESRHLVDVELQGEYTRGATIVDRLNVAQDARNHSTWRQITKPTRVVWQIDNVRWKEALFLALSL